MSDYFPSQANYSSIEICWNSCTSSSANSKTSLWQRTCIRLDYTSYYSPSSLFLLTPNCLTATFLFSFKLLSSLIFMEVGTRKKVKGIAARVRSTNPLNHRHNVFQQVLSQKETWLHVLNEKNVSQRDD